MTLNVPFLQVREIEKVFSVQEQCFMESSVQKIASSHKKKKCEILNNCQKRHSPP